MDLRVQLWDCSVAIPAAAATALFAAAAPSTVATTPLATFTAAAAPSAAATTTTAETAATATAAATESTTTTTTAATTETTATFTRGAIFAGAGDVHCQGASPEVLPVKHVHGALGFFGRGKLDEGEPAGTAGELVEHEVDVQDNTGSGEVVLDVSLHRLVGQIAHEETILVVHNTRAASNTAWESAQAEL